MTGQPLIDDYLGALRAALAGGLGRGDQARVLAETEDHLLCAVDDAMAAGRSDVEAQRVATERFGEASVVAAAYVRPVAARAVARLAAISVAVAIVFAALFVATTQVGSVRSGVPALAVASGVAGVATWIVVQLAFACAALTLARLVGLRWNSGGGADASAGDLRLLVRGADVLVGAVTVSLVLDVNGFRMMPAGEGQHAGLVFGLVLLGLAGVVIAALLSRVAHQRLGALARVDDRLATRDPVAAVISVLTRGRRHPAVLAAAAAAAVGLTAGAGHLVAEGPASSGLAHTVLALVAIAGFEGALVAGGLLAFGRLLGMRLAPLDAERHVA